MNKTKNIITISLCCLLIFGFALAGLLIPDGDVSRSERRKLQQKPELSVDALLSGEYMEELETWQLDQFPLRDSLRSVDAWFKHYVLRQSDNNGVYLHEGGLYKAEYPLDEKQVLMAADKIESITSQYLTGMDVYYSIIPDKNYFVYETSDRPAMDYGRLKELMSENVTAEYIDIFDSLTIEDYYCTDAHWRQESIYPVAETLAAAMGSEIAAYDSYEQNRIYPFYGVYMGQASLPAEPDTIVYLENEHTAAAVVTGAEFEGTKPMYEPEQIQSLDGYNVYLSGPQAVLTMECPTAESERELIIFRDSFGSSIAPYFAGAYSKVTLIDLRYINSAMLDQFVTFNKNSDVLFLYCTSLINSGALLK
ncbi:MAG: hypothetical protein E7430_02655 [Ruminococcaceae bacterium]|nr:hypothetical protein [Oscillospiraceae bacterium]